MEIKSLLIASFNIKTLLVVTVFVTGISGFTKCNAQSIVGKWQRSFTKIFTTDKTTGKQVPVSADIQKQYDEAVAKRGYKETLELRSDNTYISTVTIQGASSTSHTGNYSLSGNQLDMHIPLVNGRKTSITIQSITSGKMTWNLVFMGKLTGIIYTKI